MLYAKYAMGTCTKCQGIARGDSTQCASCRDTGNGSKKGDDRQLRTPNVVLSEVLMYAEYHRHGASRDAIVKILSTFYTPEEIREAKNVLWHEFEEKILGVVPTRQTSVNRTEQMANCEDILKALGDIEKHRLTPTFCASKWDRVPKSHPESASELGISERLAALEEKMFGYDNTLSEIKKENIETKGDIKQIQEENISQGKLIQQLVDDTTNKTVEWPRVGSESSRESQAIRPQNNVGPGIRETPESGSPGSRETQESGPEEGASGVTVGGAFQHQRHQVRKARWNQKQQSRRPQGRDDHVKKRSPIEGRGVSGALQETETASRIFFVYRVHKGDTIDKMKNQLTRNKIESRSIDQTNHKDSKYNSFKITVSSEFAENVMSPDAWPKGVKVRRWFEKRIETSEITD